MQHAECLGDRQAQRDEELDREWSQQQPNEGGAGEQAFGPVVGMKNLQRDHHRQARCTQRLGDRPSRHRPNQFVPTGEPEAERPAGMTPHPGPRRSAVEPISNWAGV